MPSSSNNAVFSCDLLPSDTILHIERFLAFPSRVMLRVALRCTHKMPESWNVLDFGEIEPHLAMRLCDDNISAILQHIIDAGARLEILKLTNCTHITGAGLFPLQSTAGTGIKKIDLSIVEDHRHPSTLPRLLLSCHPTLAVLLGIIGKEGCSLKHIKFPKKWRDGRLAEFHLSC